METKNYDKKRTNGWNDRQPKSYIAPPPFQSGAITMSICSQDIERKRNLGVNQGPLLCTDVSKMTSNNPKLDLVNKYPYIKFGEILSHGFQDIEQKHNFGINQGPQLWYKYATNDV